MDTFSLYRLEQENISETKYLDTCWLSGGGEKCCSEVRGEKLDVPASSDCEGGTVASSPAVRYLGQNLCTAACSLTQATHF